MPRYLPLFHFLRYTTPTWYFNLRPAGKVCYFPDPEALSEKDRALLVSDLGFQSDAARKADLSWQAWCKGIMADEGTASLNVGEEAFPLADEYRYVRKYFHPLWSWYVLVLRLLSMHASWKEIPAFLKSRKVKRVSLYAGHKDWVPAIEAFDSALLQSKPLVSVVIPTLNRYPWLKNVLKDLEEQDYSHFEVIVVDQSEPYDAAFYEGWKLKLRVWHQEEKALWKARNDAIRASKGEFILLYDDDSRVEKDWIRWHLKTLDFFQADLSSGVSLSVQGAKVPENYAFFRWSDQLDTGNVIIRKEVFSHIGLFDRQFEKQRMGDGEFGLRAYLDGFKNISNPQAKRLHLKVGEGGLRQMGSWDGWRPKKWWGPRPIPSILYYKRIYFPLSAVMLFLCINIPSALVPYHLKSVKIWRLVFLIFLPYTLIQVVISWRLSSQMLNKRGLAEKNV